MRRMSLLVIGFAGSFCMLTLLILNLRISTFADTQIQFQPTQSNFVQVLETVPQGEETESIQFPHAVSESPLIAERLVSYDGVFLESLTGEEVSNVAALLLTNTGEKGILYANIVLQQGGHTLSFAVSQIPPFSSVLVLEEKGRQYRTSAISACCGVIEWESEGWLPEKLLSFEKADMGSVWVTNILNEPLNEITLYYKTDYANGLFYLGGITYEIFIDKIEAGERILIEPNHFAWNNSKFLRIQCGNE